MTYMEEAFLPHLRLTILKLLASAPSYCSNSSVIHQAVAQLGLPATRDQVRTEIAWLGEQALVRVTAPADGLLVATLAERGHDVAAGAAVVPGVQRPSPGR